MRGISQNFEKDNAKKRIKVIGPIRPRISIDFSFLPAPSPLESNSEEDGGFGVCGEKTRYATLQRQNRQQASEVDEALRGLRNNINSLVSTLKKRNDVTGERE